MNTTESKPADSALKLIPPNCSLAPWNGLPIWHTIVQACFFDQQGRPSSSLRSKQFTNILLHFLCHTVQRFSPSVLLLPTIGPMLPA